MRWSAPKSDSLSKKTLPGTVAGSIGPLNGTRTRGWRLKPSSVLISSRSKQSVGTVGSRGVGAAGQVGGFGMFTRNRVF